MKKRDIVVLVTCVLFFCFLCTKTTIYNFFDVKSNDFSSTLIEGFEKDIYGSTGWAAINLDLKKSASSSSETIGTVVAGQPFMILEESGSYWKIEYSNKIGYVLHDYCMINLPDVVPSIVYNITNSYSSIYRTRDNNGYIDIPDVTGKVLYGVNCNNGICEKLNGTGKAMNYKIGREEFIVPSLYSAAKKISKAQALAKADGYKLEIFDSYRPFSTSSYVASKFNSLFNSNSEVQEHVLHSYGANTGTQYNWTKTYFISQVVKGEHISAHNVGSAIDVTLCKVNVNGTCDQINMFTDMHQLSTDSIKYYSKDVEKIPANYSGGMLGDENAKRLDEYMINSNVSMTTLASEWWHFEDSAGRTRLTNATNTEGCDFQATSIVSRPEFFYSYAPDSLLTTIGDVNADGNIDSTDAELVYQLHNYFKTNGCDSCDKLVDYSDYNRDGNVDLSDVYSILNKNNDLVILPSGINFINFDDIYIHTNSNPNIAVKNVDNLVGSIQDNKYILKYRNDIIKEFNLVSVSSSYNLDDSSIGVNEYDISSFLNKFTCNGCSVFVNDGSTDLSSGNFGNNYRLIIKFGKQVMRSYSLIYPVKNISLEKDSIDLLIDGTYQLNYSINPSYATNKGVTFESSDSGVATVDSNGLVTAVGAGSTNITVITEDGSYSDVCSVNVTNVVKYTVTYKNGLKVTTHDYEVGESIDLPNLSKTGYIFNGWKYNDSNYTSSDNLLMPNGNIELIADWTLIIPNIQKYDVSDRIINVNSIMNVSNFDLELDDIYTVQIYNKDNQLKESGYIATGDKVYIYLPDDAFVTAYEIAVKGDVNGDGLITPVDFYELYVLRKKESDNQNIKLIYKLAGDLNKDGIITPADIFSLYEIKKKVPNL